MTTEPTDGQPVVTIAQLNEQRDTLATERAQIEQGLTNARKQAADLEARLKAYDGAQEIVDRLISIAVDEHNKRQIEAQLEEAGEWTRDDVVDAIGDEATEPDVRVFSDPDRDA